MSPTISDVLDDPEKLDLFNDPDISTSGSVTELSFSFSILK
jgi:hypothetical protein